MEVYLVQTPVTNDGTASKNLTSQLTFLDSAVTTDIMAGKQWLNWDFTADGDTISFDGTSSYLFLPTLMKVHDVGADQLYYWMGRTSGGTSGTYLTEANTAPVNTDLAEGVADHMTGPTVSATPGIYIGDAVTFGGAPEPGTLGVLGLGMMGILRRRRKA
jgi:PEP-CTERM motif